ncbi:MAG TPA: RHS repeat-associated core domain-containing protein [Steroidobacter sp.]|uniref:RHS repeat domain-containing protein n=1 Tax=Steroidobacter sp. TaxID=1978227 RepID=UPI002ED8D5FE
MKHIRSVLLGAAALFLALLTSASAQDVVTYFHADATGSPIVATDEYGNLLWREDYAPYGERLRQEVSPRSNRMWFTGHHQEDSSGLIYAGARHYDPVIGRFLSTDPAEINVENLFPFNRYAYANNNPYRFVDPDGRAAVAIEAVAVGALIYFGGCQIAGSCEKFGQATWNVLQAGMSRDPILSRYLVLTGMLNQATGNGGSNSSSGGIEQSGAAATPPNPDDDDQESLRYKSSPKHEEGGWGTKMDLDPQAAQRVLNRSVQGGKQRYGIHEGKVYEFQPDNAGTWHGYPIRGNEAPTSVLREFANRGDISPAQYRQLIKGK